MRQLTDYDRVLIAARESLDLERFEAANAALDHIVPERRAEIPVLILRERIYRALGNVAGADRLAATLSRLRAYAESQNIAWPGFD